ncbi:hypothetical protein [Inquilinus ginsengisoli]|uniref:hypothetical protein n=1 Tax=Inquilinus ginsengisoli TaxID=363840 RepID=UPI00286AC5AD|nr:hypothetical protein [Inquilinus ginsengisoli]
MGLLARCSEQPEHLVHVEHRRLFLIGPVALVHDERHAGDLLSLPGAIQSCPTYGENTGDIGVLVAAILQPCDESLLTCDCQVRDDGIAPMVIPERQSDFRLNAASHPFRMALPIPDQNRGQRCLAGLLIPHSAEFGNKLGQSHFGFPKIACAK